MPGLLTEVWATDIAKNLFPVNSFLSQSINEDMWVNNKQVHRPQSGVVPDVVRNRAIVPAISVQRVDSVLDYDLHEFTSTPTLIRDIEEIEVSYNKRASVLRDHIEQINRKIAEFILAKWCPSTANLILPISGATRATNAPGGTGLRKSFTRADILKLKVIFDAQEITQDGRILLLDQAMYNDLLADTTLTSRDWSDNGNSLMNGSIAKVMGFNVYMRSTVGRMATANTGAKDPDAANVVTDNAFSLAWHPEFVGRAKGSVKVYSDLDKPEYYGSLFSASTRCGGSPMYSNARGVCAIVEATV
jgi:hypothetical protein